MQPCMAVSKQFGPEQQLSTSALRYTSKLQDALGEDTPKPVKTPAEFLPLKNSLATQAVSMLQSPPTLPAAASPSRPTPASRSALVVLFENETLGGAGTRCYCSFKGKCR